MSNALAPEVLPAVRVAGPLASITVAATTTALYTISLGRRAIIRKIRWFNHGGANAILQIGYDTLAAAWTPVMPDILMVALMDGVMTEDELIIAGNTPEGFFRDTTALTGFAGVIAAQSNIAAVAPNDVEVQIEVDEF
jgi:hypothetical protein